MKLVKHLLMVIFMLVLSMSCKQETNAVISKKTVKNPDYKKMEFHIKGMTCEIGCARLIESKLSKTKGIKFSKVIFKDSLAMVEYDTNLLSEKDINNVVNKIADGTLYKVTNNKIVKSFSFLE